MRGKSKIKTNLEYTGRSYLELILQPRFIQAVTASAFGYAVMTFLMTATPYKYACNGKYELDQNWYCNSVSCSSNVFAFTNDWALNKKIWS